jgi:hypothetical protein
LRKAHADASGAGGGTALEILLFGEMRACKLAGQKSERSVEDSRTKQNGTSAPARAVSFMDVVR